MVDGLGGRQNNLSPDFLTQPDTLEAVEEWHELDRKFSNCVDDETPFPNN